MPEKDITPKEIVNLLRNTFVLGVVKDFSAKANKLLEGEVIKENVEQARKYNDAAQLLLQWIEGNPIT